MEEQNKGMLTVRMLKQIMDSIKQHMEQGFKEMNVTAPQGMLMGILVHNGEMKISDLSERMGLSNSTVSGILDRLEKQGYVERIRSEEDRRVVFVKVTSQFRQMAQNHFNEIENKFDSMLNEITPEEADKIFEGLNLLKNLVEKHQEKKE